MIDQIPDAAIEAGAKIEHPSFTKVKGRVSRTKDGRVGRFGWKAQIASLDDFILTACAVELGLEVPGHHQSGDPLGYGDRVEGLDLSGGECRALVAYVRGLPAPIVNWRTSPGGKKTFDSIGCAACHTPNLGGVEGLYSDLLLHDMGEELQDTGGYGTFTPRSPGEEINVPTGPLATAGDMAPESTSGEPKPRLAAGASRLECARRRYGESATRLPISMMAAPRPSMRRSDYTAEKRASRHGDTCNLICRGSATPAEVPAGHACSVAARQAAHAPRGRSAVIASDTTDSDSAAGGRLGFTHDPFLVELD